jgi:Protein of unknown function (DUF2878)
MPTPSSPSRLSVPAPGLSARAPWPWAATLNLIANQAVWFLCILGAAGGFAVWGSVAAAALVGQHLWMSSRRVREAALVVAAMALGGLFDTAWLATGWVHYTSGQWHPALTPHWMLALWAAFATSLNLSMRWLQARWGWAALIGAVGGVLSFRAGAALGAAQVTGGWPAWVTLALGWALVLPLLCRVAAWAAAPASRVRGVAA